MMKGPSNNGIQPALAALARMLHYPDATLQENVDDLAEILSVRPEFPPADRSALERFLTRLSRSDLLHAQASYVETFDRSKKVSLYLFEHVHGESRERGPAMVELRMAYRERGLDLDCNDLPDYVPLFLEFCSQLPDAEALAWLDDVSHILQRIHVRLDQRGSRYALPVRLLLHLTGAEPWPQELVDAAAGEARDDTREAIDSVWCEAPVSFDVGSALGDCGSAAAGPNGGGRTSTSASGTSGAA